MILETPRLTLREAGAEDAAFVLDLLNAPGFIQGIGDRGVRTLDEARGYIETRILSSYRDHGFGMWVVTPKGEGQAVGLCGLVRREILPHVDLGYAFLERYWGQGYAQEAAGAVLAHARGVFGLATMAAIVNPDNLASRRVLEKIGFRLVDIRQLEGWDQPSAYYCA
ncbi:GNAT family N-acetyltransferase [Phenylobacterium sp.]|uniref:GNAT family N-acetyltransferase n=1 Tax=Phenylobacterium sp. TaxID=1871053 RepID=UPI0027322628|nr:GNAT family N-acetyltransferase [Phenylobacterium sp.]MDP2213666.1 GNAT family N-acetyltransferase [Phenylobacterium sp.]